VYDGNDRLAGIDLRDALGGPEWRARGGSAVRARILRGLDGDERWWSDNPFVPGDRTPRVIERPCYIGVSKLSGRVA
jgi:hypothetical protein